MARAWSSAWCDEELLPHLPDDFAENVPTSLFAWLDALPGTVFREVETRTTKQVQIGPLTCFVKLHRGVGWPAILSECLSMKWPVFSAFSEYRALRRLEQLGVGCPRALAVAATGASPASRRSYLITELLHEKISAEDIALRRQWQFSVAEKRHMIELLAQVSARMHAAGVNHRDMYLCHFFVVDGVPLQSLSEGDVAVMDLHRAQLRAKVPMRWLAKDLAALWYSVALLNLSRTDALRFVRSYSRCKMSILDPESTTSLRAALKEDAQLWRAVIRRHKKHLKREQRLGYRDTAMGGRGD